MKRNITISIDEGLAREAKVLAAQRDTSVSQLLAVYLRDILKVERDQSKTKKDFIRLSQKKRLLNYEQRTFRRDVLHDR